MRKTFENVATVVSSNVILQAVVDSLPHAVVIINNEDGTVVVANAAANSLGIDVRSASKHPIVYLDDRAFYVHGRPLDDKSSCMMYEFVDRDEPTQRIRRAMKNLTEVVNGRQRP